jgi:hypothetical protein
VVGPARTIASRFICAIGIPAPDLSLNVKVTSGFCPADRVSTFTNSTTTPGIVVDCVGIVCAPAIEASNSSSPCGI